MLTISAADEALFTALGGARQHFLRVDVKDSGGSFRDLTTYPGENLVLGATWGEDVDSPSLSGTVRLKREVELLSLAPLMDTSALNLAFNPAGSPVPLVAPGREVKIYTAVMPEGLLPSSGDWKEKLHGRIDKVGWADEVMVLQVSDKQQGDCRDAFIERERVYAHSIDADATKGFFIYEVGRTYVVGDLLIPTELKRNGHFYAISAITTGVAGAEGTYPTGGGGTAVFGGITVQEKGATTIVTGTAVETVLQQLATDNGSGVTVTTPSSPGWLIKWYLQQRVSTWAGMMQLVDQIGWDLRSRWDSGSSTFKLKFTAVDRAKSSPDRTFAVSEKLQVKDLSIDRANIRNVVRVVYSDSSVRDLEGDPIRVAVERSNSASITAFGRRFMELAEASSSQIDSVAEAEVMADAALADLCAPVAEKGVELEYFPFVELGDLYRFSAGPPHHSGNLDLAVTGYQHTVEGGDAMTELKLRGKPSGGVERWLAKAAEINPDDTHNLVLANSGDVLTLGTGVIIGGAKLLAKQNRGKKSLGKSFHFHVSESPGFTPSSSTLVSGGAADAMHFGQGYSGGTYYAKLFAAGWNAQRKVIAQASEETSFVAGFVEPHHLNPEKFRMELPPNGSFEGAQRDPAAYPPDRWNQVTGTWKDDVDYDTDAGDVFDGSRSLLFTTTSVATKVRSDYFPVSALSPYAFSAWVKKVGTPDGTKFAGLDIEWLDRAKGAISTDTLTVQLSVTSGWYNLRATVVAPADACFARIAVYKTTASNHSFNVDALSLRWGGDPWRNFGDVLAPVFEGDWQDYNAATHEAAAIRMLPSGRIKGKGLVKNLVDDTTGSGNPIATFPTGWRPPKSISWASVGNGKFIRLELDSSGLLFVSAADDADPNQYVSLACIDFDVFE